MSDSFVRLPPQSTGLQMDTEQLTVNSQSVQRSRDRVAGEGAAEVSDVRGSGAAAKAADYGLITREAPANAFSVVATDLTLARGAPVNVVNFNAPGGVTSAILKIMFNSLNFVRWVISVNGVVVATVLSASPQPSYYEPPRWMDFASAGQAFLVTAENIDPVTSPTAAYVTFWYETTT